uniref:Uncharacterized protein n=1 Tax=Rhodococcus sp. NS1 TaxID=402236 RepID=A0A097SQS1_9NOCA|nr:hypothetical protein LRS1606.428 [Rhodococcus sp. NS1]
MPGTCRPIGITTENREGMAGPVGTVTSEGLATSCSSLLCPPGRFGHPPTWTSEETPSAMTATEYDTQPSDTIVAGVDAHADTHHVVVLDRHGHRIADRQFTATFVGYRELLTWLSGLGHIVHIDVESTGTYAAALTRFLISHGVAVVEVNTPHAHTRARSGKDDRIDAEAAARKALSGESTAVPKDTSGPVEAIRTLSVTRDSAVKARSSALVQLRDLLITAPSELRESLTSKTLHGKASECIRLRPDRTRLHEPAQATKMALRTLSHRILALDREIADLDAALEQLVTAAAPVLTSHLGIGVGHAAQFLITAGQNIDRMHSEAAFARLCGAAPVPVSSGKTHRMWLHRGGDRQGPVL